jgi:hypothetical protein
MRAHHLIAIALVLLAGLGLKLFFFSARTAEADTQAPSKSVSMDISQL